MAVSYASEASVAHAKDYHSHATVYTWNFGFLMGLTILEIALIYLPLGFTPTLFVLLSVGAVKVWLIAMLFMHLRWDAAIMTKTALVPVFFVSVMFMALSVLTQDGPIRSIAAICGFQP